ncbi:MAG: DUF2029 domain-containing protein [Chloroflexi bacterium]|nr:DUF2029 domain-containing protein [Chloroflexota bacterium]
MRAATKSLGLLITLALLAALFQWRATQNYITQNYYKSNFFVFWLSGKLILEGKSPYNAEHWENGHTIYGNVTPREPTFLYPLPLAVFLTPLGLLSVGQAYFTWQWLSQISIALVVYFLLKRWNSTAHDRLLAPVMCFLLFFGPIFLTLQVGALGPLTLLFIFGALHFLDENRLFPAGILLSLTMLKPSQGGTILFLLGLVFLMRRQWKAIFGVAIGGLILLIVGLVVDPDWLMTFRRSSEAAFDRRLGAQSNVWSFSYLACNGNSICYSLLGSTVMVSLLGITAYFLWRNQNKMTNWQVFNFILPVAFGSTLYLWAYDQILYVLPILWILGTMVEKSKRYLTATLFLIVLDAVSFFALVQQAFTDKDLWSLATTVLVLAFLFIAQTMKPKPAIDKAPASA